MTSNVYKLEEIDTNKISYIKSISQNTKESYLVRYNNNKLYIELPKSRIEIISEMKEKLGQKYFDIGIEVNYETDMFFTNLDDKIVNDIKVNKLCKKYKNTVKRIITNNNTEMRGLKVKINSTLNNTVFFSSEKKEILKNNLNKNDYIKIVVEINQVWINKDGLFGLNLVPLQIKQVKLENSNSNLGVEDYFIKESNNSNTLSYIDEINELETSDTSDTSDY